MKKQFAFIFIFFSLIFGLTTSALAVTSGLPLVAKDGHQAYPRISGQYVLYADNDGSGWGLSLTDTSSKEQKVIASSSAGWVGWQGNYDISGTKVVYTLSGSIYLYDISTAITVKIPNLQIPQADTVNSGNPSIDGNFVALTTSWSESATGASGHVVALYNIATGETKQITEVGAVVQHRGFLRPAVSGNKIVYEANMNGQPADLYLYDISSGQSSIIGVGLIPRIYGDYVIWSGFGNADPITLYQISTRTQKVIGTGQAGEIYGDTVVYWSAVDNQVHLYSISSGKTIIGFGNGGGFTGPDIYEKTLVWADSRTSPPNLPTWPLTDIYFTVLQDPPTIDSVVINNGRPINANAGHGTYPYNPTNETAVSVAGHVTDANKVTINAGTLTVDVTPDMNGNFGTSLNFFSVADGDVLFTITPKDTVTQTSGTPFMKTVLKDTWIPRIVAITSNATTPGVLTIGDTIEFILSVQDVPFPDIDQKIIGSYNSRPLSWSQTGTNGSYSIWKATYTVQAGDQGNSTPLQITGVHAIDGAGNESDPRLSNGGFNGVDSGADIQKTISVVDITAPFIFDLSVSSITPTSATISWTTNEVADGEVYIGTNNPVKSGIYRKVESKTLSTTHSFTLTGLNASTTYFYVVESRDASRNKVKSNQQSFVTLMGM